MTLGILLCGVAGLSVGYGASKPDKPFMYLGLALLIVGLITP
jgi:hypothetical protein